MFWKNVIPRFFQSPRHSFEISTMVQVCNLRDYHDELKPMVDIMDPAFKPQDLSIWTENLPTIANQGTNSTDQLVATDKIIDSMAANTAKLQFEADSLSIARDAAQLARLYGEVCKSSRALRLMKVHHLRQENQIGSSLVAAHMEKACKFIAGPVAELTSEAFKVGVGLQTFWIDMIMINVDVIRKIHSYIHMGLKV